MYQLRASWRGLPRRCCAIIAGCGQLSTARRRVSAGRSMANDHATAPPQSCPTIAASRSPKALDQAVRRRRPARAWRTRRRRPASRSRCSRGDRARRRESAWRAPEIWWRHEYQDSGNPCSRTTSGPSPSTTQWRRTPLVRTSRCSSGIRARLGSGSRLSNGGGLRYERSHDARVHPLREAGSRRARHHQPPRR